STDEADAAEHIRPYAFPVRTADGHAYDHVTHQVQHAVIAEVGLRAEEARVVPEVDFAANDSAAHGARAHAERAAAVVNAAAEGGTNPWNHPTIRSCLSRREHQGHRSCQDERFDDSFHCLSLLPGGEKCKRDAL